MTPWPAALAVLLAAGGGAAGVAAAGTPASIPWRDHHQAFASDKGVYFVGGNVDATWTLQIGPQPAGAPTFKSDSSVLLLSAADAKVSTLKSMFPSLVGHSCAVHQPSKVAYCTGGLRAAEQAESGLVKYDTTTDSVTSAPIPGASPRAFHASAFLGDSLYLFGGLNCLTCPNVAAYGAGQTFVYNITSNVGSTVPVAGNSAPPELVATCAIPLPDATILLIGGAQLHPASAAVSPQLYRFDPASQTQTYAPLSASGKAPSGRWGVLCRLGPDKNTVYVQGGCDPAPGGAGVAADVVAMYALDIKALTWSPVPAAGPTAAGPTGRCFAAGAMVNGYFVLHGGKPDVALAVSTAPAAASSATATPAALPATPEPAPAPAVPNNPAINTPPPAAVVTAAPAPAVPSNPAMNPPPPAAVVTPDAEPVAAPAVPAAPNAAGAGPSNSGAGQPGPSVARPVAVQPPLADTASESKPVGAAQADDDDSENDWTLSRPDWWPKDLPFPRPIHVSGSKAGFTRRATSLNRRQAVAGSADSSVYIFDTTSKAWSAPVSLIEPAASSDAQAPNGGGAAMPDTAIVSGAAEPPSQAGRTKAIVAALLLSMVAAALIFGFLAYYWWKNVQRPNRREMAAAAKKSGMARVFRVRTRLQRPGPDSSDTVSPSERGVDADYDHQHNASSTALLSPVIREMHGGPYLDPDRHAVIPLLAPIQVDGRSFMDVNLGPGESKPLNPFNNMPQDLSSLSRNLGDISFMRLERSEDGGTLPARKESVFRRRSPQEMLERTATTSKFTAHSVSQAVSYAVADAIHGPAALPRASSTSPAPSPSLHGPQPAQTQSTSTGYVLDQPLQYAVVYPHIPRLADEIELLPGDTIAVAKIYRDGWCRGTNLRTGLSGVFPLLAVEEAEEADVPLSSSYHDKSLPRSHQAVPPPATPAPAEGELWWNEGGYYGAIGAIESEEDKQKAAAAYSTSGSIDDESGGASALFGGQSVLFGSGNRGYGTSVSRKNTVATSVGSPPSESPPVPVSTDEPGSEKDAKGQEPPPSLL
ncbi:E3 ubiquitin-protein ligase sh3rf3 [Geranomyces michiganensis]|nr:E3 ubiquitin-protein ligase sh3rf3 [Geranomyces michiganensis]